MKALDLLPKLTQEILDKIDKALAPALSLMGGK
jgi:hypothetical protein